MKTAVKNVQYVHLVNLSWAKGWEGWSCSALGGRILISTEDQQSTVPYCTIPYHTIPYHAVIYYAGDQPRPAITSQPTNYHFVTLPKLLNCHGPGHLTPPSTAKVLYPLIILQNQFKGYRTSIFPAGLTVFNEALWKCWTSVKCVPYYFQEGERFKTYRC